MGMAFEERVETAESAAHDVAAVSSQVDAFDASLDAGAMETAAAPATTLEQSLRVDAAADVANWLHPASVARPAEGFEAGFGERRDMLPQDENHWKFGHRDPWSHRDPVPDVNPPTHDGADRPAMPAD